MPKITFEVDLQDGASPALQQIVEQARAAGVEIKGAFNHARPAADDFNRTVTGTSKVIREDREEHRLRVYAIRGASGALTALTGEGTAFTRELQTGVSQLFQMDFALKVVADQTSRFGGSIANVGGIIGSSAIPISVAVGALLLLKNALDEDRKKSIELAKAFREAQVAAGDISADPIKTLSSDYAQAARDATQEWKDANHIISGNFGTTWRNILGMISGDGKAMAQNHAINMITAAATAQEKIRAEQKKEYDTEIALDEEITIIKAQRRAQIVKNEINAQAKEKLIAEEAVAFAELDIQERAAIRKASTEANADNIIHGLKNKFQEKRLALEADYTGKYKDEAQARKDADDANGKEVAAKRHAIVEDSLMDFNAQTALKKQQIVIDSEVANRAALLIKDQFDMERKKVTNAADVQAQILAIDEQTAMDEERRKDQQFRHLDTVQKRFELQRQLDAQQTQTKLAQIDKKEQDSQEKKWDSVEKMMERVSKTLEQGFGNAIGQVIMESQNFGEAFVGVAKKVIQELIVMISTAIIFKTIMGLITGGAGAAIPVGMEEPASFGILPQYAKGADFVVPPGFDNDTYPIGYAKSGERVQITPSDQAGQPSASNTSVTINISAMDAKGVRDAFRSNEMSQALLDMIRTQTRTGR